MVMPLILRDEMFESIENRLKEDMKDRTEPYEIATTFNYILFNEFEKKRKDDNGVEYSLNPVFVGQYVIDSKSIRNPDSPEYTRVFSDRGTGAHSPIELPGGIIGRAYKTGEDQCVPDVSKDLDHIACDPNMHGTEHVYLSWSDPYTNDDLAGHRIPLGVLDIDLNLKNALSSERDKKKLRKIWNIYGKLIFPGEPNFRPSENIALV